MRRSKYRRASSRNNWFSGKRRIIAVAATLVAFGGIVTVTQVSNASTDRNQKKALAACDDVKAPERAKLSTETRKGSYTTNNGTVTQHADDGAGETVSTQTLRTRCRNWVMNNVGDTKDDEATTPPTEPATSAPAADPSGEPGTDPSGEPGTDPSGEPGTDPSGEPSTEPPADGGDNGNGNGNEDQPDPQPTESQTTPPPGAGLGVLTNSCDTSNLAPHDGFQLGSKCVSTEFGEVGEAQNNPSLLITRAPRQVGVNQPFTLRVSTRNLIRDRFLAAGKGGYYVESSVLRDGLVRGHFHTACRMLENTNSAPAPDPVPAFFVATEDSKGGAAPDSVDIQVPGLPAAGTAQCASWAGDGSHRIPMMVRANQTPAFDVVRITVRNGRG